MRGRARARGLTAVSLDATCRDSPVSYFRRAAEVGLLDGFTRRELSGGSG